MKIIKKSILILLFVFNFLSAYSKDFVPDSSSWIINSSLLEISGARGIRGFDHRIKYQVLGDTSILDMKYQKLYRSYENLSGQNANNGVSYLYGFLRQDSNRVYMRIDSTDKLIYDFNLNLNDTFTFVTNEFPVGIDSFMLKVVGVDYVLINNTKRKRIIFDELAYCRKYRQQLSNIVWIEGVGDYFYGLSYDYSYFLAQTVSRSYFYEGQESTYLRYRVGINAINSRDVFFNLS